MRIHLTTKVTRILRQRLNLRGITALYLVAVLTAQLAGMTLRFSMKMMLSAGQRTARYAGLLYYFQAIAASLAFSVVALNTANDCGPTFSTSLSSTGSASISPIP